MKKSIAGNAPQGACLLSIAILQGVHHLLRLQYDMDSRPDFFIMYEIKN